MPKASNLAILLFSTGILEVTAHNFMKRRSGDDVAAKGLFIWYVRNVKLSDHVYCQQEIVHHFKLPDPYSPLFVGVLI